jgi:hypothetical protein
MAQMVSRPQMLQVIVVLNRQLSHRGPPPDRVWTGRRRPHPMQISW